MHEPQPQIDAEPFRFPARISPHHREVERRNVAWLRSRRLLDDRHADRYASVGIAEFAARLLPDAELDDIVLACDTLYVIALFDDFLEGARGQAMARTAEAGAHLVEVLHGTRRADPGVAHEVALTEVWERQRADMSRSFTARAAVSWEHFFAGHLDEAHAHTTDPEPTADRYLQLRADGPAATRITVDLLERCNRLDLPVIAYHCQPFRTLRSVTGQLAVLCNDLYSYTQDVDRDELNILTVLGRQHGCELPETAALARQMLNRKLQELSHLTVRVDELGTHLGLPTAQQDHVHRYARGCLDFVRAVYEWSKTSARYHGDENLLFEGSPPTGHIRGTGRAGHSRRDEAMPADYVTLHSSGSAISQSCSSTIHSTRSANHETTRLIVKRR
ncbi:terpene synthase family protein [Nocardia thraciensis]